MHAGTAKHHITNKHGIPQSPKEIYPNILTKKKGGIQDYGAIVFTKGVSQSFDEKQPSYNRKRWLFRIRT